MSLDRLASLFRKVRPAARRPRPARGFRLLLEQLEDRVTPTTVMNLNDSGAGSLRQAILDTPAGGTVNFQSGLSGTITLFSTPNGIAINKDLNIVGPGPSQISVNGNNQVSFNISSAKVTISGLTLTGGSGVLSNGTVELDGCAVTGNKSGTGAGVFNYGSGVMTLFNCLFSNNTSGNSGAIQNQGSQMTILNCQVVNNHATGVGGGIGGAIGNDATMFVIDSLIGGNTADLEGGAIQNQGTLTLTGTIVDGNTAGSFGGGIDCSDNTTLTLDSSTVSNNTATAGTGGGIYDTGTVTITNSTVVSNKAQSTAQQNSGGGGIAVAKFGKVTLESSTVAGNSAAAAGGGIENVPASPPTTSLTLHNTIVALNATGSAGPDVSGAVTSQGFNLVGITDGSTGWGAKDLTGTAASPLNPQLGPPRDNGGPTPTTALLPSSPALTAGDPALAGKLDQRGITRSGGVSIGAYQASPGIILGEPDQVPAGVPFNVNVTARDAFGNPNGGYRGTVHFSSSDAQAVLPPDYTFSAGDNGGHNFAPGVTLNTPGAQTVMISDGTLQYTRHIIVSGAASPSNQLVVGGFPNPATAGAAGSITVTAEDANGKVLTGYMGKVHFTSTDPNAVLPADYTFTPGDAGTHTFTNLVTLKTAGAQSITVTDNGSPQLSGGETNITVNAAAASSLTLSGLPSTVTTGSPVTVTVTARDPYNNLATGYRGTVHFTSSDGQAVLPGDYPFGAGDGGTHTFTNGVTLKTLGAQSVTISDGTLQNTANTTVVSKQATQLVVTVQPPGMVAPGAPFGLTVAAEDDAGGVDTSYGGNVTLTLASNPGGATLGGTTTVKASGGVATFSGLTLNQTGIGYQIQAGSGSLTPGTTNAFDVDALALSGNSVLEFRPVGTAVGTLATTPGTGHTYTYSLVSGTGSTNNAAFKINGGQLVTNDAFDAGAKSSYSVRVRTTDERGLSIEQPFTVTITDDPALALNNGTLVVSGTAGNDTFSFTPATPQDNMKLNGTALAVDAASVSTGGVVFNGNGGSDSATLTAAGSGPTALTLLPGGGLMSGPGYAVRLNTVGQVVANGRPGDRASLFGSGSNDAFVGTPAYAYLSGNGYLNLASGFGVVVASGGGTANFLGDPKAGGNVFVATPPYAYLRGAGFFNQANGFKTVVGTDAAGTDQAYLYGSGGNVFVGTPTYSYLYGGGGPFEQANGFPYVVATASGSGNTAYLFGAAKGGNALVAGPSYAYLSGPAGAGLGGPGGTFINYAAGFQTVVGTAGGPGDVAYLYGVPGNTLVATSSYAVLSGGGMVAQANGFGSVYAYSGGGGQAVLYGTMTAADTFVDYGSYAVLFGDAFFDLASGFASVSAPFAHR